MGLIKFKKEKDVDVKEEIMKKRNILLYGKLDDDELEDVLEAVLYMNNESQNEPINLFISSNGGDVDSGMALYDLMQWLPTPFHTIGMGVCASMAAILLMGGQKRYIFPHCWVMLHQSSGYFWGDTDTTITRANQMEQQEQQLLKVQALHTGQTVDKITNDTIKEKWFNAQDAVRYGIVDGIIDPQIETSLLFKGMEQPLEVAAPP